MTTTSLTTGRVASALAAALIGAVLASTPGLHAQTAPLRKNIAMTNTAATAQPPMAGATTYCLGRFLIDVPAGSKISGWGSYKYDFAQIEKPVAMNREQFDRQVALREAVLQAANHKTEPRMLLQALKPTEQTNILVFWKGDFSTALKSIEGYRWIDGSRFLLKDEVGSAKQEFGVDRVSAALANLRPRADTDIPTEPGYCFGGGFIANAEWENEEASINIDIAGHPDAFITVTIYPLATRKKDKPLLERMGGAVQQLGKFATGVRVLRKGDRDIGPIKHGQEYLVAIPNSGGFRAHSFTWETQGEGTLQDPSITIELETGHQDDKGNPQQTRLSDEQAMTLWDQIVNSFRLRPVSGQPIKTSDAAPPDKPLGELAATGRACPQTGVWETVEASAPVQGGKQQFFSAGERMPHAVLQGEPTVWQKLMGETPTHQVATVWRLVAYDPSLATKPAPMEGATSSSEPPASDSAATGA